MKNTFITFIVIFPTLCFSQVDWSKAKVTYGAENEKLPIIGDTIKEFNNKSEKIKTLKFRDSQVLTIIDFNEKGNKTKSTVFPLENLKYKTLTKYNDEGLIVLIASYDNGIVTGNFKKFYDNGKLMEEGVYEKMKKIGEWKYYNDQGVFSKSEKY